MKKSLALLAFAVLMLFRVSGQTMPFGPLYSYSINGRYQLPAGYKTDVLPKSVSMQMPDKGIIFKRVIAEQDGFIIVHYSIDFKNSVYNKNDYPAIRDFYKKMYEMLNEQIVLKKS